MKLSSSSVRGPGITGISSSRFLLSSPSASPVQSTEIMDLSSFQFEVSPRKVQSLAASALHSSEIHECSPSPNRVQPRAASARQVLSRAASALPYSIRGLEGHTLGSPNWKGMDRDALKAYLKGIHSSFKLSASSSSSPLYDWMRQKHGLWNERIPSFLSRIKARVRLPFMQTVNFMIGVAGVLGTVLYLGNSVTDQVPNDASLGKPLEQISSLQYLSTFFLLLNLFLLVGAKVGSFGYADVLAAEVAREASRRLADDEEQTRISNEKERLTMQLYFKDSGLTLGARKKWRKQEDLKLALEEGLAVEIQQKLTRKAEKAAEYYETVWEEYSKVTVELEDVATAEFIGVQRDQLFLGLARVPHSVRYFLRVSLLLATLASGACIATTCVCYFFIFKYKASHAPHAYRYLSIVGGIALSVAVLIGHLLVICAAIVGN